MAWFDLVCITLCVSCGVYIHYALIHLQYWSILIGIFAYLLSNFCIYQVIDTCCAPYKSDSNPKHLVVLCNGYLGHYLFTKGLQQSFKHQIEEIRTNESVMVYVAKTYNNGFFLHTLYRNNDGIRKGAKRLYHEITNVIKLNRSIEKISFIGGSAGGLYNRCCLSFFEIDSIAQGTFWIDNRSVKAMNFITLATPNIGADASAKQNKLCCGLVSEYDAACWLNKYCLITPTLQELLVIDKDKLIVKMCTNNQYLRPLQLFEKRVCFANLKYDKYVCVSSGLILFGDLEKMKCEECWNTMKTKKERFLIEEIQLPEIDEDEDFWLYKFRNEVKWTRIIVCWDQNYVTRFLCHFLLAAPAFALRTCRPLFQMIHKHFVYS